MYLFPNFTSIEEVVPPGQLVLYPNPGNGLVNIGAAECITAVEVLEMSGRCVHCSSSLADRAVLQLNNLTNGTYVVRVSTGNGVQQRTLVITGEGR